MATLVILRAVLIVMVASCAFLYHGSCAANEAEAERQASPTDPLKMKNNILRVDLIRRDSPLSPLVDGQILSNAERLRRAIQRSRNRLSRFQHYTSQNGKSYYSPISFGDGEFLMQMAIGSPVPLNLHFILDTGSDLIWTQCQPCSNSCVPQNDPIYNPSQSSSFKTVPCSNRFCLALPEHSCNTPRANCSYYYLYGDGNSTSGVLAYETFSLATVGSPRRVSLPHVSFGCGDKQDGFFNHAAGIVGMGRGPLSLVSQIGSSVNHVFSYCLGSYYNASQVSPLFLGKAATLGAGFRVTPLVANTPFPTFYYLGLRGISVAGKAVPIPKGTFEILANGSGGLLIDSGTTTTILEDPGYKPFLDTVRSTIPIRPVNTSATTGYDLCYNYKPALRIPIITFHFAGGAKYVLPEENSFALVTDGIVCLMFASAGPAGSSSIFGNYQQQNFHIVYDLGHNKLYFAPTNCQSI